MDSLGNIYVADFVNTRVQQFAQDRSYARSYGVARVPYLTDHYHYNSPAGVAAAPDGSLYIVEDNGHRLVKLNAAGQPLWTVGVPGLKCDWDGGDDKPNNPIDVVLDSAGRVLVADQWHGRVQIFDSSRAYLRTIGVTGANGGDFGKLGGPDGLAVDAADRLQVADDWNSRIQVFDVSGAYLTTIDGSWGASIGQTRGAPGVAVASNGEVFVADWGNHRVQKFARGVPGWSR